MARSSTALIALADDGGAVVRTGPVTGGAGRVGRGGRAGDEVDGGRTVPTATAMAGGAGGRHGSRPVALTGRRPETRPRADQPRREATRRPSQRDREPRTIGWPSRSSCPSRRTQLRSGSTRSGSARSAPESDNSSSVTGVGPDSPAKFRAAPLRNSPRRPRDRAGGNAFPFRGLADVDD